jgi:hypothetical protein
VAGHSANITFASSSSDARYNGLSIAPVPVVELRDLVLQRLNLTTEAIDFLVPTFAGSRRYRRRDRLFQLQAQPPVSGRPSQAEYADHARPPATLKNIQNRTLVLRRCPR